MKCILLYLTDSKSRQTIRRSNSQWSLNSIVRRIYSIQLQQVTSSTAGDMYSRNSAIANSNWSCSASPSSPVSWIWPLLTGNKLSTLYVL